LTHPCAVLSRTASMTLTGYEIREELLL